MNLVLMDLVAIASILIQQSANVEVRVDFDQHGPNRYQCQNYSAEAGRGRATKFLSPQTFVCSDNKGNTWTNSSDEIIDQLRDENYRPCIYTGGIAFKRSQTSTFCIGDL